MTDTTKLNKINPLSGSFSTNVIANFLKLIFQIAFSENIYLEHHSLMVKQIIVSIKISIIGNWDVIHFYSNNKTKWCKRGLLFSCSKWVHVEVHMWRLCKFTCRQALVFFKKNVFLKFLQTSEENISVRFSFLIRKLQASRWPNQTEVGEAFVLNSLF